MRLRINNQKKCKVVSNSVSFFYNGHIKLITLKGNLIIAFRYLLKVVITVIQQNKSNA